jgi:hypothetical protein
LIFELLIILLLLLMLLKALFLLLLALLLKLIGVLILGPLLASVQKVFESNIVLVYNDRTAFTGESIHLDGMVLVVGRRYSVAGVLVFLLLAD